MSGAPPDAPRAPSPSPLDALWLVALAWLLAQLTGGLLVRTLGLSLAAAAGLAAAAAGVTALAWRALPAPRAGHLGLRGFDARLWLPLVLLLPAAFLGSGLEHAIRSAVPPPDLAEVARVRRALVSTETTRRALESVLLTAAVAPALEEWIFRGVVQPGACARLGAAGGVVFTAALFGLWHGAAGVSAAAWLAAALGAFGYGLAFGLMRHASGSLWPPIALHAGINGLAVLGSAARPALHIPAWNAPGDHLPLAVWIASAASVALGAGLALRLARGMGTSKGG